MAINNRQSAVLDSVSIDVDEPMGCLYVILSSGAVIKLGVSGSNPKLLSLGAYTFLSIQQTTYIHSGSTLVVNGFSGLYSLPQYTH